MTNRSENPITSAAGSEPEKSEKAVTEFKVAEVRADGTAVLEMEDGRMFLAKIKDGLEGVNKRATVVIKAENSNKDGVPLDAEVVRVK